MNPGDIDYSKVASNIPYVLQSLYVEQLLKSVSLIEIRDAFRVNQMQSKAWLLSQLSNADKESKILIIGAWMGFSGYCLYKMGFSNITEVDLDSRLEPLAYHINRENKNFKRVSNNVNNIDVSGYDIIINTSCEHIDNNLWFKRIPKNCLILLQSTNFKCQDHTNVVNDIEAMKDMYSMRYTYEGELKFNPQFSRFMLCGVKDAL